MILLAAILGLSLQAALPPGTQTVVRPAGEPDWDWLEAARPVAFERLMPLESRTGLFVAYRRYRDLYHDAPELYFKIDLGMTAASASLVEPAGASFQVQLLRLHAENPRASVDTLLQGVTVTRLTVPSGSCPALDARIDAFADVKMGATPNDVLFLHPVVHRIVARGSGLQVNATSYDPEVPIVRWVEATIAAIRTCAGGR